MTRPLRVLHVEAGRNLYGGALQVVYLLDGLRELGGTENILVCPEGSAVAREAGERGHAVRAIPMRGDLDLLLPLRLAAIIRTESPDVVHLHSRRGGDVLGGVAAYLESVPCVLTRRVDNPESRFRARLKYRLYDRVVTISEGIRGVLLSEGVPAEKVVCVRSAVDAAAWGAPGDGDALRREFGLPDGAPACGVVAQFIERKGHRVLFDAVPDIVRECPGARFILFGKGPLEPALKALAREKGIAGHVVFAGFREDLPRLVAGLDLLVHPAFMEGLGVSLLQAAAAGVPLVGSRAGGIPEAIRDGVNGLLVPPGDPGALARAVVSLLRDPERRRAMGEAGQRMIREEFSIRTMAQGNLAVYRGLPERDRPIPGSSVPPARGMVDDPDSRQAKGLEK